MPERTLQEIFSVDEVLPEEQDLVVLEPRTTVQRAIEIMCKEGFSALPVMKDNHVLGVFSFRSLATELRSAAEVERDVLSLPVESFLERYHFAQITDEMSQLFNEFDLREAVLVGKPTELLGIVTTIDALRYFYKVASPYVLLREIELAIRALIKWSISATAFSECVERSLGKHYRERAKALPDRVENLTFHDYVMIVGHGENWPNFEEAFGGTRMMIRAKLKDLPELRNDLFHFRREITASEYDELRLKRDWLLDRIRLVSATPRGQEYE